MRLDPLRTISRNTYQTRNIAGARPMAGFLRSGVLVLLFLTIANRAAADMPMLPVPAYEKLVHWWVIPTAVIIETYVLIALFGMGLTRAVAVSTSLNLVTIALGFVAYPITGFALYPATPEAGANIFGVGLRLKLTATLVVVALFDTVVELGLLRWIGKFALTRRRITGYLVANMVGSALLGVAIS